MHAVTSEILALYERMKAVPSLTPRNGYDAIGTRLSELVIEPRSSEDSEQIILELEEVEKGIINAIRDISIRSEIELELYCAQKAIDNGLCGKDLFENLMQDYPYQWYDSRAVLEASFINKNIAKPKILIIGNCGIPHSGFALGRALDCSITWLDPYQATCKAGQQILEKLGDYKPAIEICAYPAALTHDYDYAFCHDSRIFNAKLIDFLTKANCPAFSASTNHGLAQLLYFDTDFSCTENLYEFDKGFIPPHYKTDKHEAGWQTTPLLSYGSSACYKRIIPR